MKCDCDKCQRPLIHKKAYEKLDELADGNQMIVCLDCRREMPDAKIVSVAGGAYLVQA